MIDKPQFAEHKSLMIARFDCTANTYSFSPTIFSRKTGFRICIPPILRHCRICIIPYCILHIVNSGRMSNVKKKATGKTADQLERERSALLAKLATDPTWLAGSLTSTTQGGRGEDKKRYPFHYLSRRGEGKNIIRYVREEHLAAVKAGLLRRAKANDILDSIAEINLELIRIESQAPEKSGRPRKQRKE